MTNREYLIAVVKALGSLADEVVFTGGRVVQEYQAVPALREPRVTVDADVIVEAATYAEYAAFGERLRQRGFAQSAVSGTPPYRWNRDGLVLDVMPLHGDALGFTNQWYRSGVSTAVRVELAESVSIWILDPPHFLASKLEAYRGRGDDDPYTSHDLEDVISVVASRPACVEEARAAGSDVSGWIAKQLEAIFLPSQRLELVAVHLDPSSPPGLVEIVAERITGLIETSAAS